MLLVNATGLEKVRRRPGLMRRQQRRAVGPGHDARAGLRRRLLRASGREGLARHRQAVVVGDGVVLDRDLDRVLQRDAAAGQARHVVHDDVVVEVDPVPATGLPGLSCDVLAVDRGQADAAAVAGAGRVALDQVAGDLDVTGARAEAAHRQRRGAADEDAAAGDRLGLVEALVEEDLVVGDQRHRAVAAVTSAQAGVADAGALARGEVAADPVPGDGVRVGAGAHRDAAAGAARARR